MELYREKSRQIPDITGEHVSRMVEKLAKYLAGPDFGEHVAGHMPHEYACGVVAELSSAELVYGDGFLSWFCCGGLKSR